MRSNLTNLTNRSKQGGISLVVSLIMLLLITMMALTSFKLSKGSLQIAGNQQQRNQTFMATQGAIEQVISSVQFADTPENLVPTPCESTANTVCNDVNGDGVVDVRVAVSSSCISVKNIKMSDFTAADFEDQTLQGCFSSREAGGVDGSQNDNSQCANMLWNINGVGTDATNNAKYTIDQGTALRTADTTACP